MSGHVFLCLYHDLSKGSSGYSVRLQREDPLYSKDLQGLVLCSLSPLFPAGQGSFFPNDTTPYDITFTVCHQPFIQIGRLDADSRRFLWYSLGITALVAITPKGHFDQELWPKFETEGVLLRETWSVDRGTLPDPLVRFAPLATEGIGAIPPESLPQSPDVRPLIRELYFNFASLIKRSQTLKPTLLPTAKQMLSAAGCEVRRIVQLESRSDQPPPATGSKDSQIAGQPSERERLTSHKQRNLALDALVQLNSGLVYVLSQSFYGGPPLLKNHALNSCHSLLGIGTAIKAIQLLTEFIIEGFAQHPVYLAIEQNYPDVTLATHLRRKEADRDGRTVDHYLAGRTGRSAQTPKLAYFSTRMGFSEHTYCVTAATQCLSCADSARRSLLTLTHELLHSHVKGLFAAILADAGRSDDRLLALVRAYRGLVQRAEQNQVSQQDWTILEYLHYRLFAFCDGMHPLATQYPTCRIDPSVTSTTTSTGPNRDDHAEAMRFRNTFEFMNELVVHVLDLHYFYDESQPLYLAALWTSWSTVPGVADHIEWYILRSIVAVSVVNINSLCREDFDYLGDLVQPCDKSLHERFESSLNALVSVLEDLCHEQDSAPMLHVTLAKAKEPAVKSWLRRAFFPSHLFAQNVKQFLYSPKLRTYFDSFEDPLADRAESGDPVYKLESLEFPTGPIRNPVALLRDRLRREFNDPERDDEEARSAWLFLALASVPTRSHNPIEP